MPNYHNNPLQRVEAACGSLLDELQIIWDEVGETNADRDKMLLELEEECIEVYRRKVDQANQNRAQLRQAVADSEAELAAICSAMGERPVHIRQVITADQNTLSLREELTEILTYLDEMRKKKADRRKQLLEVSDEIERISNEISGSSNHIIIDGNDLSIRKLEELQRQLYALEKEKKDRLKQIHEQIDNLNSLCLVLGLDFKYTANEIDPGLISNLGSRDISNETIRFLSIGIDKLREIKLQRMQKLQDLASTMLELWNLMDTPPEEQQRFQSVTCNIAASENEITQPNSLTKDFINHVAKEVSRLEGLKASKMKELVLKKRSELEEMCRKTHMLPEVDGSINDTLKVIDSGTVDPFSVLEEIEVQIANVKEEAFTRKDILEKVDKWLAACEEESWLEDYNKDDNRYNAGRGSHLNLKRAEKARKLLSKLPGIEETLALKIMAWEKERGIRFIYDGVHLLSKVEDSSNLRQQKEEERRRQRDLKKLQGQMLAEQETLYGSRSSPLKPQSAKKSPKVSTGSPNYRNFSGGGSSSRPDSPLSKKSMFRTRSSKKMDIIRHNSPDDDCSTISNDDIIENAQ